MTEKTMMQHYADMHKTNVEMGESSREPACCEQEEVKMAFDTIKAAMIADGPEQPGSYAHSWHCNLAMCFYAELMQHEGHDGAEMCNAAASRFMKMCFGVDTKA